MCVFFNRDAVCLMKKEQSCFSLMSSQGCLAPFHLVELSFSVLLTPFASPDSPRGSGYHRYPLPLGESGMTHGKGDRKGTPLRSP